MNLFAYKNLWRWLDNPFETPPEPEPAQSTRSFLDSSDFAYFPGRHNRSPNTNNHGLLGAGFARNPISGSESVSESLSMLELTIRISIPIPIAIPTPRIFASGKDFDG